MSYQPEPDDQWPAGVYQIAVTDPVLGGPDGPPNLALAALTARAKFQRLRNVTPWSSTFAYPIDAYVQYGGKTYKSIATSTNVPPGTDVTKWIRWGHTEAELDIYMGKYLPYGAPPTCPNTGPDGTADKAKIYKSALGEYWQWLGDVWGVVYNRYGTSVHFGSSIGVTRTTPASLVVPRAGRVKVTGVIIMFPSSDVTGYGIRVCKNGNYTVMGSTGMDGGNGLGGSHERTVSWDYDVLAGDVVSVDTIVLGGAAQMTVNSGDLNYQYIK